GYMIHEGFPHWYCYSWSVPDGTTCPSTRGIGLSADSRVAETKNVTQDVSLNLKWNVNDRLALNFDLQHIDSTVDNFDNSAKRVARSDGAPTPLRVQSADRLRL